MIHAETRALASSKRWHRINASRTSDVVDDDVVVDHNLPRCDFQATPRAGAILHPQ
jgi:hypothetical protein